MMMTKIKRCARSETGTLPLEHRLARRLLRFEVIGGPYDASPPADDPALRRLRPRPRRAAERPRRTAAELQTSASRRVTITAAGGQRLQRALWRRSSKAATVYVGCMGGWGRTGLFLALMVKALMPGVATRSLYVRENYRPARGRDGDSSSLRRGVRRQRRCGGWFRQDAPGASPPRGSIRN